MINKNLQLIKQCLEKKGYEPMLLQGNTNDDELDMLTFNRQDNYIGCMHCWAPLTDLHLRAYSLGVIFEKHPHRKNNIYSPGYMCFIKNAFTMDKFLDVLNQLDEICIEMRKFNWLIQNGEAYSSETYIPYYHTFVIEELAKQQNYTILP